ncbi:MAG: outer membrane beta-barrel protein [Campylobacterota bacterium]|nr:outer membrane beta-barrel protein [Campylobacterota bacterium]
MIKKLVFVIFLSVASSMQANSWKTDKGISSIKEIENISSSHKEPNYSYQEPSATYNHEGFYVGVAFGNSSSNGDEMIEDIGGGKRVSAANNGSKVQLGYQIRDGMGMELSYTNYGKFIYEDSSFEYKSANIDSILGFRFFNKQIRPAIVFGIGYLTTTQTGSLLVEDYLGSYLTGRYGINILFEPNVFKGIGFSFGYEANFKRVAIEKQGTFVNATDEYLQNLGLMSFGIQYKF